MAGVDRRGAIAEHRRAPLRLRTHRGCPFRSTAAPPLRPGARLQGGGWERLTVVITRRLAVPSPPSGSGPTGPARSARPSSPAGGRLFPAREGAGGPWGDHDDPPLPSSPTISTAATLRDSDRGRGAWMGVTTGVRSRVRAWPPESPLPR